MGLLGKIVTSVVVTVGTEVLVNKVLPIAAKKGKKLIRDLEEKAKQRGN